MLEKIKIKIKNKKLLKNFTHNLNMYCEKKNVKNDDILKVYAHLN